MPSVRLCTFVPTVRLRRVFALALLASTLACGGPASAETETTGEVETETTGSIETGETETDTGGTETETGETDTGGDPNACWTDLMFGEHEVLYQGFTGGSEGISFGALDGLLYVTSNNRVWQVTAAGEASEFSDVPDALGLAPVADGGFVVASIGEFVEPDGVVYEVDANGGASALAMGIDSPNFVAIAPDGSALVSDDFDTRVFRVTGEGDVEVVIADVPSPNGMAYSPDGTRFYVASTFTSLAQLTRFDVGPEGLPIDGTGVEILHMGMGAALDGIAVDAEGMVYVAVNLRGEIWRVDGSVNEVVEGEQVASELGFPASVAFGRGPGFDPCSLYVTQLQGDLLQRVFVGVGGAELYL